MTERAAYLAGEARWLLSFGMHPADVAHQLNAKPRALYDIARKHNLEDLRATYSPYANGGKS